MQMYVNFFDRQVKLPEEAPTVGIILCKQENKALVRITLPKDANILDEAFAGIATARANAEKNLQNARAVFKSYLNGVFAERGTGWVAKLDQEKLTYRLRLNYSEA
jgi:hypothetical protein